MFCPNCGQQHVSPVVRYCSRCGFSLRGVLSVRRKDIVQGGLLMFIGLMIIIGFNDFMRGFVRGLGYSPSSWSSDYILPFFSAVFFIWGLSRIIFALIIERNSRLNQQREAHSLGQPLRMRVSADSPSALPPSQGSPVAEPDMRRLDTTELGEPPSVTEESTKLLKNK